MRRDPMKFGNSAAIRYVKSAGQKKTYGIVLTGFKRIEESMCLCERQRKEAYCPALRAYQDLARRTRLLVYRLLNPLGFAAGQLAVF
jgi:hypothetical protein